MAIKLLAFDLDGTIVKDDQRTITEKSIEAIRYAKEKGVVVVIATGRIASGLPKAINVDKYIDYVVTANGARLQQVGVDKPLYKSGLNYKKVDELAALAERLGIFFELYCDGKSYALRKNIENIDSFRIHERFYKILSMRPTPVDSIQ